MSGEVDTFRRLADVLRLNPADRVLIAAAVALSADPIPSRHLDELLIAEMAGVIDAVCRTSSPQLTAIVLAAEDVLAAGRGAGDRWRARRCLARAVTLYFVDRMVADRDRGRQN